MAENNNSLLAGIISIHAPPRGATLTSATVSTDRDISIHAPPRGATLLNSLYGMTATISIHAPPRGATVE